MPAPVTAAGNATGFEYDLMGNLVANLADDTAHAFRGLRRSPGEPLPYRDSDRPVRIVERAAPANPGAPLLRRTGMSWAEMAEWRKVTTTISEMAFILTPPITLMPTAAGSARLTGALVALRHE